MKEQKEGEKPEWQNIQNHEKETLLKMSEISLWLDNYNDIFSDFDPRPYSQRALSDDFLQEAKRASKDKVSGSLELQFLIPHDKRNTQLENTIKKRLREHFKKHYLQINQEVKGIIRKGLIFMFFGIIFMFLATFILFKYGSEKNILMSFLIVLLEPAGWFSFWEGLNLIIFNSKKKKPELDFYEKMSSSEILFLSY